MRSSAVFNWIRARRLHAASGSRGWVERVEGSRFVAGTGLPGIFGRGRRRGKGRFGKVQVNDRDNLPTRTATLLAFHGIRIWGRGEYRFARFC